MSEPTLRPAAPPKGYLPAGGGDYEYRMMTVSRVMSRGSVRQMLTDLAEQQRWELAAVRVTFTGHRRIWVRRRIIRIARPGRPNGLVSAGGDEAGQGAHPEAQ